MRIGVDVGGTFTDVVLLDDATGAYQYAKTPTTPHDPADGVLAGIEKILTTAGVSMGEVDTVVHGTTIGTNALLERKGARVGLITTAGFEDVLEIGRLQRMSRSLYDFWTDNPPPLVPRYLRKGVRERIGSRGQVITPLDEGSVLSVLEYFAEQEVEALAVSLLFSFLNGDHEERVAELCREQLPDVPVSLSSATCSEFREYERTSTTVMNAYLEPVTKAYVRNLVRRLDERYGAVDLRIMQASGGCMKAHVAEELAVQMVNSGPAGGAIAGAYIGRITDNPLVVTVDMGGTSFDISLIERAQPTTTSDGKIAGLPIKIPVIDIDTIGAGGGSIAWIDKGGALNVGPESAGAYPGPVCYDRGGTRPTVTDANLLLGRLSADYFLGGELSLALDKARDAMKEHVGDPLGMSVEEAAAAIIRIVNATMAKGISVNSVEKGHDVRDFAIVAFGGAGALHAVQLAQDLSVERVIVPPLCGNLSAFGLLVADTQHDYVQTVALRQADVTPEVLTKVFQDLEADGVAQLAEERVDPTNVELRRSADLRYQGQSYEINVPVAAAHSFTSAEVTDVVDRFHEMHQRLYSYSEPEDTVEFINLRVRAVGRTRPPEFRAQASGNGGRPEAGEDAESAHAVDRTGAGGGAKRPVYFEDSGWVHAEVHMREDLPLGGRVEGPSVIQERVSSTLLPPGSHAEVDPHGNLVAYVGAASAARTERGG